MNAKAEGKADEEKERNREGKRKAEERKGKERLRRGRGADPRRVERVKMMERGHLL